MEKAIDVDHVYKKYGQITAVNGLTFAVEKGQLFAFLGPNGAGKSTTIAMICTLLTADEGTIMLGPHRVGQADAAIRQMIGAVFQEGVLDERLTIEENLQVRGSFYNLKGRALQAAVLEVAHLVGVHDLLKRRYGQLSGGQRRRCDIARALIHTPQVLFLDEPTTGLDPQTRKAIWETIRTIQQTKQMTIFLTTHYMEEAEHADYVVVIDEGQIAAQGTPEQLKVRYAKDTLLLVANVEEVLASVLQAQGVTYQRLHSGFAVELASTLAAIPIIEACAPHLQSFEVLKGTMDDVFIAITGKEIRE